MEVLRTHLSVTDAHHDVESSVLAEDQFKVFILHKGTLEEEQV